jgi:hypothetical protein
MVGKTDAVGNRVENKDIRLGTQTKKKKVVRGLVKIQKKITRRHTYIAGVGPRASSVASDRRTRARILTGAHSIPRDDHVKTLAGVVPSCGNVTVCECVRLHFLVSVCKYVCVCGRVCMCVCLCIFTADGIYKSLPALCGRKELKFQVRSSSEKQQ